MTIIASSQHLLHSAEEVSGPSSVLVVENFPQK